MRWSIIYDNLTVARDEGEEAWKNAPPDGVQFVINDEGILLDSDFYYYYDGAFYRTDDLGPLLRKLGIVKFGRTASTKVYEQARMLAEQEAKQCGI